MLCDKQKDGMWGGRDSLGGQDICIHMENRKGKAVTGFFFFLGSKIFSDSDCSHEIKRHLFLGRKAMTNLGSILK